MLTLAWYFAASPLLTSMRQSMPGSGRPSSTSRTSGRLLRIAAAFLAAAGSRSGSSADSWICTGLPVGGPARGAVTSTRMPGISAVFARIPSMISCAGARVRQSANSNWMTPIVSSPSSFDWRGCSPERA